MFYRTPKGVTLTAEGEVFFKYIEQGYGFMEKAEQKFHEMKNMKNKNSPRKKRAPDHLKWLHTMVSNAKAFIGGTFHGLSPKHLQAYLDEFCFRTNQHVVILLI